MQDLTTVPMQNEENQNQSIKSRLFAEAQLLGCECDQISGLALKQFFISDLTRRIYEASRYEIPVSVCLIRIEQFAPKGSDAKIVAKSINGIARGIENSIRQSDLATWYSPSEFLIEMPHASLSEALDACQRIETIVKECLADQNVNIVVTAQQVETGDTPPSILGRLDVNQTKAGSSC